MAQTLDTVLPAQSALGADIVTEIAPLSTVEGTDNVLTRCVVAPPSGYTTVTGGALATTSVTISLEYSRAGAAAVELAHLVIATGTNLVANTPLAMALTGTQAQLTGLQQDDTLQVRQKQSATTGLAMGAGVVVEAEFS